MAVDRAGIEVIGDRVLDCIVLGRIAGLLGRIDLIVRGGAVWSHDKKKENVQDCGQLKTPP